MIIKYAPCYYTDDYVMSDREAELDYRNVKIQYIETLEFCKDCLDLEECETYKAERLKR